MVTLPEREKGILYFLSKIRERQPNFQFGKRHLLTTSLTAGGASVSELIAQAACSSGSACEHGHAAGAG